MVVDLVPARINASFTRSDKVSLTLCSTLLVQSMPAGELVVSQVKAKEFLSAPRRPRRNLWDRSRPDVQQWIQQFMYMGYDEAVSLV